MVGSRFTVIATALATLAVLAVAPALQAQTLLTASFGGTQATDIRAACPGDTPSERNWFHTGPYCFGVGPRSIGYGGYSVTYTAAVSNTCCNSAGPHLNAGTGGMGWATPSSDVGSSITMTFSSPVTSVGSFITYFDWDRTPTISAYDARNTLIASYNLAALAPISGAGGFRGISYSGGISSLRFEGSLLRTQDLYAATVPEPSSITLLAAGLAGLGVAARRRRSLLA